MKKSDVIDAMALIDEDIVEESFSKTVGKSTRVRRVGSKAAPAAAIAAAALVIGFLSASLLGILPSVIPGIGRPSGVPSGESGTGTPASDAPAATEDDPDDVPLPGFPSTAYRTVKIVSDDKKIDYNGDGVPDALIMINRTPNLDSIGWMYEICLRDGKSGDETAFAFLRGHSARWAPLNIGYTDGDGLYSVIYFSVFRIEGSQEFGIPLGKIIPGETGPRIENYSDEGTESDCRWGYLKSPYGSPDDPGGVFLIPGAVEEKEIESSKITADDFSVRLSWGPHNTGTEERLDNVWGGGWKTGRQALDLFFILSDDLSAHADSSCGDDLSGYYMNLLFVADAGNGEYYCFGNYRLLHLDGKNCLVSFKSDPAGEPVQRYKTGNDIYAKARIILRDSFGTSTENLLSGIDKNVLESVLSDSDFMKIAVDKGVREFYARLETGGFEYITYENRRGKLDSPDILKFDEITAELKERSPGYDEKGILSRIRVFRYGDGTYIYFVTLDDIYMMSGWSLLTVGLYDFNSDGTDDVVFTFNNGSGVVIPAQVAIDLRDMTIHRCDTTVP